MTDPELVRFLQEVLPRLGLRWPGFRKVRGQVRKRLGRRLGELGLPDLGAYRALLEETPAEWPVLDGLCRITISRFYRDRSVFEALRARVLGPAAERALARGGHSLRCLSAGCASGEEPYTLAIAWHLEQAPRLPGLELELTAIDADPHLLARAREASYPPGSLRALPPEWLEAAFERRPDGALALRPALRRGVIFQQQDVRAGLPEGPFSLVLCRNLVFTYFSEAEMLRLLAGFHERTEPEGILVLGCHEELPAEAPGYQPLARGLPIYQRTEPR